MQQNKGFRIRTCRERDQSRGEEILVVCFRSTIHINRNEISRDLNRTQNTLLRAECWSSNLNINVGFISIRNSLSPCSGKTTTLACYCFSTILCSFTPMQNFVPRLARPSFARRQNSIKDHLRFQQVICYFTPSFRRQIDEQEQRRCRRRAAGFGGASAVAWKTYISVLRAKQQSAPSLPFSVPPSVRRVRLPSFGLERPTFGREKGERSGEGRTNFYGNRRRRRSSGRRPNHRGRRRPVAPSSPPPLQEECSMYPLRTPGLRIKDIDQKSEGFERRKEN